MDKDKIGAILKNRIKECGYTQEGFSQKSGIGLASLKKYMKGKVAYNYDVLDILAAELDCSYDYLLGKSKSPKPKYASAKEMTRLSEKALEKLEKYAKTYDTNEINKAYIDTIDALIIEHDLIQQIFEYFIEFKPFNQLEDLMYQGIVELAKSKSKEVAEALESGIKLNINSSEAELIYLVSSIKNAKTKINPILTKKIRKEKLIDKATESMRQQIALIPRE